jgi:glucosyl-dolichyl phosphate glucuronosyltransferase
MLKKAAVILTRYNEKDSEVLSFIKELLKQRGVSLTVYFFDQRFSIHIRDYLKKIRIGNINFKYMKKKGKSLGEIRNLGIKKAKENIVIFSDIDMLLDRDWAKNLIKGFKKSSSIAICGGSIEIKYLKKPRFYHNTFFLKSIYGFLDPTTPDKFVSRVNGGNLAVNKARLSHEAYFNSSLGRKEGKLFGGEDTDICRRAIRNNLKVFYFPEAKVFHKIGADRMSLKFIIKSFFYQGRSKEVIGGGTSLANRGNYVLGDLILLLLSFPIYISGKTYQKLLKWKK